MPILNQVSSGPDVTNLQQRLKDLGFDPNGVDGNFGADTEASDCFPAKVRLACRCHCRVANQTGNLRSVEGS
jgi:hypothetical protein